MVNPEELLVLYSDFLAEAEYEFDDERACMSWCNVNDEFLKWLAEENRIRAAQDKDGPGSFAHMRRLFSANA